MIVTKIEAQKKKKNRFNIYLDDVFAFGVDEATLLKFALFKGSELTQEEIDVICTEDIYQQAYQKSLQFLNFKLRTAKEVYEKLEKLDYPSETIDRVLGSLVELGFVNDRFYAESYLNENFALGKKGPKAVMFELRKKGINDAIIQQTMEEFGEEAQLEQAIEVGQAYLKRQTQVSVKNAKQKVYTHLMQKGYERDVIQEAIQHLTFEVQEEKEMELATKEAAMGYKKLHGKKPDSQIWYQVKAKLYQKGYDSEVIEQVMEQLKNEVDEWI